MANNLTNNLANNTAAASAVLLHTMRAITDPNTLQQEPAGESGNIYNLNSGLFPCLCVAMYGTILSPTSYEERLNEGEDEFWYNTVDTDDWKKALTEAAQDYLDDTIKDVLRDYGLQGIKAQGIWSPKYYNYRNDELEMTVTMQDGWQNIMARKVSEWQGNEAVKQYIGNNWKSFSGYVNFMPESLAEILTEDDEERQLAAYLTLALVAEGVDLNADNIMEDLYYRMDDFSCYRRVNVFEEYYDSKDEAEALMDLWDNDYRWCNLYWDLYYKIGSPWSRDKEYETLDGKADCWYEFRANNDGKRLLFWAAKNHLTVKDLQDMAA